jgi:DNA-binding NarL/FixJ family response regulator/DNA-binding winged helix-turn-helix (wHTH) protein
MDPSLKTGFRLGSYRIDPLSGEVAGPEGVKHVQPKVMDVLLCLIEHDGKLVERDAIVERVWGRATSEEALTRCISELRSALGDDRGTPRYIQTVPKRGYRLLEPVVPLAVSARPAAGGDERARPFTVLLVDDHALFREGLKLQLEELDESIVCLEAGTCEEALALAPRSVDLVLLDYGLPGVRGLEAIAKVKRAFAAPVTIVSANDDAPTIRSAIANGAVGFIPKSMSKREFFAALGLVRAGAIYLPPQVLFGARSNEATEISELQRRLLAALMRGKNDTAIAAELGLSETDFETELHRAYRTLGVDNRIDAVYELAKRGIRLA